MFYITTTVRTLSSEEEKIIFEKIENLFLITLKLIILTRMTTTKVSYIAVVNRYIMLKAFW